jgi:hypothetical protein
MFSFFTEPTNIVHQISSKTMTVSPLGGADLWTDHKGDTQRSDENYESSPLTFRITQFPLYLSYIFFLLHLPAGNKATFINRHMDNSQHFFLLGAMLNRHLYTYTHGQVPILLPTCIDF